MNCWASRWFWGNLEIAIGMEAILGISCGFRAIVRIRLGFQLPKTLQPIAASTFFRATMLAVLEQLSTYVLMLDFILIL